MPMLPNNGCHSPLIANVDNLSAYAIIRVVLSPFPKLSFIGNGALNIRHHALSSSQTQLERRSGPSVEASRAGPEVVVGDLLNLDDVANALKGVDAAYFVYPIFPGLIEATTYFAQAAKEAGLSEIVNMSQISARREAEQPWSAQSLDRGTSL